MIRYINIKNYKGLKNIEYNFALNSKSNSKILNFQPQENENYNLIYGKNAIGKTRFLSIVEHLKNILFDPDYKLTDSEFFISFSTDKFIYNLEVKTTSTEIIKIIVNFSTNTTSKKFLTLFSYNLEDYDMPNIIINHNELDIIESIKLLRKDNKSFLLKILKLTTNDHLQIALREFGDFLFENVRIRFEKHIHKQYINWQEYFEVSRLNVSELIDENAVNDRKKYSKKINIIIKEIDKNIKEIDFGNYPFEEKIDNIKYYKQEEIIVKLNNGNNYSINSENVSQGITRIISILQDFIWVMHKNNRVLIIDEFDPYIHDFLYLSLTRVLMSTISESSQIIAVSHNSVILNELKRKQIIFMDEIEDKIKLFNPDAKDINFQRSNIFKRYINEEYIKNSIFDSDIEELFYD